jgi:hypothetical protein
MGAWLRAQPGDPFSDQTSGNFQQAVGFHWIPYSLVMELPFAFCRHSYCHDEGIWFSHHKAYGPSLGEGDLGSELY